MKAQKIESRNFVNRNFILWVFSGMFFLVFTYGLLNSRPAADDYCFGNSVENFGTLGSLQSYIFGWTPTYSSYAFVHYFLGVLNTPTSLIAGLILGNVVFFFLLYKIFDRVGINPDAVIYTLLILALGLIVWISGSYSGENLLWYSFFWISSLVVHTIPVVLGSWIFLNINKFSLKLLVLLTVVLGGMGFAETVAWFGIYAVIAIAQRIHFTRNWNPRLLLISAILAVVAIISYKMPGTGKRSALMDSIRGQKLELNIPDLFVSFVQYSGKHVLEIVSFRGFLAALIAGFLITVLIQNSPQVKPVNIGVFSFLVGAFQLITASLAGVFSYFAPWHGTATSISWFISFTFFSIIFWKKVLTKLKKDQAIILNIILTIVLGTMSLVYLHAVVGNIETRSAEWDKRWRDGSVSPVPALDINGRNLVEDTESAWVVNCYSGWRD
jgi:hypothetical protein